MNNKYPVIGELNNQNCKSEKTESERRDYEHFMKKINNINSRFISKTVETIEGENIVNIKELFSFHLIKNDKIPKDFFNIICDNAIKEMENPDKIVFTTFRDVIYDMLIYNLDITECVWYILQYFIHQDKIKKEDCSPLLEKIYIFLTYYNNNYRPIYHLESIFYYFIIKIHGYSEYEP
jgi:hypothetical protein